MVDRVHPAEQVGEQIAVAGVTLVEVGPGAEVRGLAFPVHRRVQRVEDHDLMAEIEEAVAGVGSDEPRASGNENLHFLVPRLRSATSR